MHVSCDRTYMTNVVQELVRIIFIGPVPLRGVLCNVYFRFPLL